MIGRREAGSEGEPTEPGVGAFVWGVWGLLSLASLGMVARFGSDVPTWDDLNLVPAIIGEQSMTIGWLWEPCNEHRIFLPKLILVGMARMAGHDVRAGMFASVVALSALAAALLVLMRGRGGLRASDAVFPLLLLHPGHATNLLWMIQFAHVASTAVGTGYLVLIGWRAGRPGWIEAVIAGLALVLLPLSGGTGLMYVAPLAGWLLIVALAEAKSAGPGARRRAGLIALATVPALILTGLYFQGFEPGRHPETQQFLRDASRTGVQFLAGGIGTPGALGWPVTALVTLGLTGLAVGLLVRACLFQPAERVRALGLLAFLAAMLALAAAVGWGRGWAGDRAGFQERYITMAAPLWCWMVVVFRLQAPPTLGGLLANALFAGACILFWPNLNAGLTHARTNAERFEALARDVHAGEPPFRIVRRYTPFLHPSQDLLDRFLPIFRRGGIGPFEDLRDNPPLHRRPLSTTPTRTTMARWDASTSTAHVTGVDPQLFYELPARRAVAGIRLIYSHTNDQGAPARFRLSWTQGGHSGYSEERQYAYWTLPTGEGKETTIWVDDLLDAFRIQPDNRPCTFRVEKLELLEP